MKEVRGLGVTYARRWAGYKRSIACGVGWCIGVLGGRRGPGGLEALAVSEGKREGPFRDGEKGKYRGRGSQDSSGSHGAVLGC